MKSPRAANTFRSGMRRQKVFTGLRGSANRKYAIGAGSIQSPVKLIDRKGVRSGWTVASSSVRSK